MSDEKDKDKEYPQPAPSSAPQTEEPSDDQQEGAPPIASAPSGPQAGSPPQADDGEPDWPGKLQAATDAQSSVLPIPGAPDQVPMQSAQNPDAAPAPSAAQPATTPATPSGPAPVDANTPTDEGGAGDSGGGGAGGQDLPPPINSQELKNESTAVQQDMMNGHITPEQYSNIFQSKDTLGKIGTIFGLLIGGAGSGLSGQPNALLGMMNKQIDRDFEASKASASNALDYKKLNQNTIYQQAQMAKMVQEGKVNEAQAKLYDREASMKAYTQNTMIKNNAALHSLVMKAQKLAPGTRERQAADQQLAMLSAGVQNENFDLADRAQAASALGRAAFGAGAGDTDENQFNANNTMLRMSGNAPAADDLRSRHMPGVPGLASVPLTGADRDQINAAQSLMGSLQRLKDFSQKNPYPLKGSKADVDGKVLAAQAQGDFRQATHGGVFKEGEQNFIDQIIPGDPTEWSPVAHVADKIDTVINETNSRNNQFLASKGFPQQKQKQQAAQGQDPKISQFAAANKLDYGKAAQILAKRGYKAAQ